MQGFLKAHLLVLLPRRGLDPIPRDWDSGSMGPWSGGYRHPLSVGWPASGLGVICTLNSD